MNRNVMVMCLTLFSCCCTNIIVEQYAKDVSNSSAFLTFFSYLTAVTLPIITDFHILRRARRLPMKSYLTLVVLEYSVSLLNNMALSFNIDMPTHLVFKSGNLFASMLVSKLCLHREYPYSKYVSVLLVTVGIVIATHASGNAVHAENKKSLLDWSLGVAMMTYCLFGGAVMGVLQEQVYKQFGKHKDELLFYIHLLGLPGFFVVKDSIYETMLEVNRSRKLLYCNAPYLWVLFGMFLVLNIGCIRGIYHLLSEWSSLSVTMVTTFRKFLSLMLSIYIFDNNCTKVHWFATTLVFTGSLIFSGVLTPNEIRQKNM